jgi:RNA polymerase sigma-B factor
MQERTFVVNGTIERLSRELGHSPSPQQIAIALDMPLEHVLQALEATAAYHTASLESPRTNRDGETSTVADSFGEIDERFQLIEDRESIVRGVRSLPEREKRILQLRFSEGLTQAEIAERMSLSQMHVSRLIRRSLQHVRVVAGAEAA